MQRQMPDRGSAERPRTTRRGRLAALGLSGVVVLGGVVPLAAAHADTSLRPGGSATGGARSSAPAHASAPVGLLRSAKPAQLARVRAVDAPRPVRVGMRFKAKVDGRAVGARVYQPFKRGSATPRSAQLWSASGKRLAQARIERSAGKGWKTVRFDKPVRLRAGAYYTVSAFSPRGTHARTVSGFRRGIANRYLAAPAGMNGVVKHAKGGAPARPAAGHPNFWVDVVFRPAAAAGSGGSTNADTPPAPTTSGPRPQGCAAVPSACGYPDATNTGPASVTGLTQVPGAKTSGPGWTWNSTYRTIFVSGANAVLDRLDVNGAVVIDAPNVTLSNSRIAACGGSSDSDVVAIRYKPGSEYQGSGARVVNNEIIGTPAGCDRRSRSGVRDIYGAAPNALVKGNDISGTGNGITIEHEGVVEDNWIHDLGHVAGDHHSGISNHGGAAGVVVRHNTVLLHGQKFAGGGGVSGALTVYSDFGHAQNVTLQDNLISGGSYVVYGGDSGDESEKWPAPTNIKILSNRFVCGDWLYGAYMAFDRSGAGNELADNYCDQDGRAVR